MLLQRRPAYFTKRLPAQPNPLVENMKMNMKIAYILIVMNFVFTGLVFAFANDFHGKNLEVWREQVANNAKQQEEIGRINSYLNKLTP